MAAVPVTEIDLGGYTLRPDDEMAEDTTLDFDSELAYGAAGMTSLNFEAARFRNNFPGEAAHTFSDSEMRKLHEMFNLWTSDGINAARTMDNFNRFYALYPEMEMPANLKSYVFITRPDLNIYDNIATGTLTSSIQTDGMAQRLKAENPEILMMLSRDMTDRHDFIAYLQGRTQSIQIPDVQIRTSDFTVPFFSYKYAFPTVMNESETGGSFEITFREDNELRITKLFNFWIHYMDAVNKNRYQTAERHIIDNSFDYMCSVYEFICDPTSEWILFWTKYTGCVPVSVPTSNLSFSLGDSYDNKVGISFQYIRTESLRPSVLSDFTKNVHYTGSNFVGLRDADFDVAGASLVSCPAIIKSPAGDGKVLLKWFPMQTAGPIYSINRNHNDQRNKLGLFSRDYAQTLVDGIAKPATRAASNLTSFLKNDSSRVR